MKKYRKSKTNVIYYKLNFFLAKNRINHMRYEDHRCFMIRIYSTYMVLGSILGY